MSSGPEHYREAEALLANARHLRNSVADPNMTTELFAIALNTAELDMKAAHVHAMLAVAAATAAGYKAVETPAALGSDTFITRGTAAGWDTVLAPTSDPN